MIFIAASGFARPFRRRAAERERIESLFRDNVLKVLVCTSAFGVRVFQNLAILRRHFFEKHN